MAKTELNRFDYPLAKPCNYHYGYIWHIQTQHGELDHLGLLKLKVRSFLFGYARIVGYRLTKGILNAGFIFHIFNVESFNFVFVVSRCS